MCDSVVLIAWIEKLSEEDYSACQYPFRHLADPDTSWIEFRELYAESPLTGAEFSIIPLGELVEGALKRAPHGRIAGYQVSVNVPACLIGHNRLVVNSVYQGAKACMGLLKFWLALNGCKKAGLDNIQFPKSRLISATPIYLFEHGSEKLARQTQAEFRTHTEALLNKPEPSEHDKPPAYSYPKRPSGPDAEYKYTSYVRDREYKITCYVKELNQPNAFLLPVEDQSIEEEIQDYSVRTLRLEIQVHEKWLKDKFLDNPLDWRDKDAPYEVIFDLMRGKLRLDDCLRDKRMKVTTVDNLKLNAADKELLIWHLGDRNVLDHHIFTNIPNESNRKTRWYATRKRIFDATGICIYLKYSVQIKDLSHELVTTMQFPGEYAVPAHLQAHIFSRISADAAVRRLANFTADVLEYGIDAAPMLPERTISAPINRKQRPLQFEQGLALGLYRDDDEQF
jgi:hypothetical protein